MEDKEEVKRQDTQKKAFTRWVNSKIQTGDKPFVNDLFVDLRDGNNLLTLLETLTGRKTTRVRGALRLHKLNNINVALDLLKEYKIKLVNIGNTDIVDGVPVPTLGLIWSVIYRFQIQGALSDILQNGNVPSSPMDEKDAEKAILQWCANAVEGYEGVDVKNFSTSWKDGLAFNALIHRYKPNLFIYKSMLSKSPIDSLEHAFTLAEKSFGVHRLLEPSDFQREMIDSRLVVMYVSTLYEKLKELDPKPDETVTLEEIEELKTYIKTELEFLEKSGEFFEHASDLSEQGSKEDSVNQYEKLIAFIDDLQPHQVRVGELVVQIESLIAGNLIAEEEIEPLSSDLDALKKLWQTIFDQTSERQEKLREMLLDTIETPMNEAFEELQRCKEKLQDFSDDADRLTPAWNQYSKFQDYVNELRQLESKIETIRTGDEIGDALAVLSDEDAEVVSTNIQGMIEGFISLGQDVADAKDRITENLYQLLNGQMKDLENTLQTAEKVTTNDLNNNTESLNLHERQAAYKGLLEKLYEIKPNIDSVSSVCRKLDENFDIEGIEVNQLKQKAVNLEEGCEEQIENLQKLCVQVIFNELVLQNCFVQRLKKFQSPLRMETLI